MAKDLIIRSSTEEFITLNFKKKIKVFKLDMKMRLYG